MGTFDSSSPATNHQALSDIDAIRLNKQGLRDNESSNEDSPPSNPVPGQFWHTADTQKIYQRTNAGAWQFLWSVSDLPARASELTTHTGANITASVTVHGIRQGSGNGLDADTVDGNHASAFAPSSHTTATSGTHGVGAGSVVGTTLTQTLTNKTLGAGNSITENISVTAGKTIDGRDISVDGAKLDTYPGSGRATPSDNSIETAHFKKMQIPYTALSLSRTFCGARIDHEDGSANPIETYGTNYDKSGTAESPAYVLYYDDGQWERYTHGLTQWGRLSAVVRTPWNPTFYLKFKFLTVNVSSSRWFVGFSSSPSASSNTPTTHIIAFRKASSTSAWSIYVNNGGGSPYTADIGVGLTQNTVYEFYIEVIDGVANFYLNREFVGSANTSMPSTTQNLTPFWEGGNTLLGTNGFGRMEISYV